MYTRTGAFGGFGGGWLLVPGGGPALVVGVGDWLVEEEVLGGGSAEVLVGAGSPLLLLVVG
ncbi:hypothetical protein [Crossiella sp. CA-258035]|uniref:hypothetical protein n=1 Tax=Crossiella sp. CA-258035 TaxID=2981138 RepID=UPI0032DBBC5A